MPGIIMCCPCKNGSVVCVCLFTVLLFSQAYVSMKLRVTSVEYVLECCESQASLDSQDKQLKQLNEQGKSRHYVAKLFALYSLQGWGSSTNRCIDKHTCWQDCHTSGLQRLL